MRMSNFTHVLHTSYFFTVHSLLSSSPYLLFSSSPLLVLILILVHLSRTPRVSPPAGAPPHSIEIVTGRTVWVLAPDVGNSYTKGGGQHTTSSSSSSSSSFSSSFSSSSSSSSSVTVTMAHWLEALQSVCVTGSIPRRLARERVVLEGNLLKRGRWNQSWRLRTVLALNTGHLLYFSPSRPGALAAASFTGSGSSSRSLARATSKRGMRRGGASSRSSKVCY